MSSRVHKMRAITPLHTENEKLRDKVKGLERQLERARQDLMLHEILGSSHRRGSMRWGMPSASPNANYSIVATISLDCRGPRKAKGAHIIVKESIKRAVEQCDLLLLDEGSYTYEYVSGVTVELKVGTTSV